MNTARRHFLSLKVLVLFLLGAWPIAEAHNLQTRMVYMFLDQQTQAMLDARIAAGWVPGTPLLQIGDELGMITKVVPDPNGTTTGVGGHIDFYVPNGVTVLDVGYMRPDGAGGFVKTAMKGQSPIAVGAGPIGTKTTPELSALASTTYTSPSGVVSSPVATGGVHRGTIAGVYGDTGIFFSTSPETAWGTWQDLTGGASRDSCGSLGITPGIPGATITNNSGDVIIPCNKWDAEQLFAWGAKGTTYAAAALRSGSTAIVDYPDQRGNAPWGYASGVAGPQSGYAWAFDWDAYKTAGGNPLTAGNVLAGMGNATTYGPWQRIQYPGSRISLDNPGNPSTLLGYASTDASTLGVAANTLPGTTSQTDTSSPKTIRWAVGQLTQGRPEYVWVKVRVDNPANGGLYDASGCPLFRGDTFGGDAGGSDNGKDHLWRYYEPTVFRLNGCVAAGKPATTEFATVGQVIQYKVKAYNLGTQSLTNVTVTDTLPSGLQFLGAAPAQNSGPNPLVWNIGSWVPGQKFEATLTVKVTGTGQLNNCLTITGKNAANQTVTQNSCDSTFTDPTPFLVQEKEASSSSIVPGAPVTYTLTVSNTGTGPTASPIVVTDYLPTGFTYTSFTSASLNGAVVTPTINASNPAQPSFSFASPLEAGRSLVIKFVATASPTITPGTYCNTYAAAANGVPITSGSLGCLTVGGGRIGDTVFRDWNGNGNQDPGEEGMPGVTVTLTRPDSTTVSTTTDANGHYLFTGLLPGTYTVTVPNPGSGGVPNGYTQTADPNGAPITNSFTLTLAQDEQNLTVDWGYKPGGNGSIGDLVFDDKNRDGLFNGSPEVGISGVTVFLYEDSNGNGVLESGDLLIATATTNGSGIYGFTGLATDRSYLVVAVDGSGSAVDSYFPNPYVLTTSNPWAIGPAQFSAQANNVTTADFGYYGQLPASIGDQVFIDSNGNGVFDAGEPGIGNVTVSLYLDLNGNGTAEPGELRGTTVTDGNGLYLFNNLGPGGYLVVLDTADPDIPTGYVTRTGLIAKTLAAGENYLLADFPFRPVLAKTVDKAQAANGNTLLFQLRPTYSGSDLLSSVRILDPVPLNTTYLANSATPAASSTGAYVPIAAVPGSDAGPPSFDTAVAVSTNVVTAGTGSVTVTVNLKTGGTGAVAVNNVSPTLEVSGGTASCTGPSPASATVPTGTTGANFTYTCTLTTVGEYIFSATAEDAAATTSWPDASSASVLAVAPGSGTSNIITWNLGSNTAGTPSEDVTGGAASGVYAFQGGTQAFSKYSPTSDSWAAKALFGANVKKGGALTTNGNTLIYGLQGDAKTGFKEYNIATNTWTAKTNAPAKVGEGGAAQYLTVSGNHYVYALMGGGTKTFSRYSVSGNSWTAMVATPGNVKKGGALTTDGTYIYALQGNGQTAFWRCNATTDNVAGACSGASGSWTTLTPVPSAVGWGGSLARIGGFIYALSGNNTKNFYRYDIAGNTWTALAPTPAAIADGGALTTDGTNLYAVQGKAKTAALFWRYNVASNTWTQLTGPGFVMAQGGALTYVQGSGTVARSASLTATPTLVTQGGSFQVTMRLYSASAVSNVSPGTLTATGTNSAAASCTLQAPTSQNMAAGETIVFTWNCTATTAGSLTASDYSSVRFSAAPSGTGPVNWSSATSNSVLISPVLQYTTTIGSFPASCVINNTGIIAEQGGALGSEASPTTITAGTTCGATIGDRVWSDTNGDGVQDPSEPGLAGVDVYIDSNNNGVWDSGEPRTTTNSSGLYSFNGLAAGNYTVRTVPSTYPPSFVPSTPVFVTKAVAANATDLTFDFGLQPPRGNTGTEGSIGDTIWLDANNNGTQDGSEAGLPGIIVKLYRDLNGNGVIDASDPLIGTQTTDADGKYRFIGLPIGTSAGSPVKYLVQVDEANSSVALPYPYTGGPTTANLGAALDPTTGTTNPRSVSLYVTNADVYSADFGYNWVGTIGDTVFYDTNGNGTQDAGENGVPNVTLALIWDQNGNGSVELGEPALTVAFTNGSGQYFFNNLPPGRFIVQVAGQTVESPSSPGVYGTMVPTAAYGEDYAVSLPAGGSVLTADFGFIEGARVEGHVYYDVNFSGVRDGGEPGLGNGTSDVTVTLTGTDYNGNPVSRTFNTNAADGGEYFFLVPPGVYTVSYNTSQTTTLGYPVATTPTSINIAPTAGVEIANLDFGVGRSGGLGDRVWNDANGNGIQDTGETGIAGVTVSLYASDGTTLLRTTVTNASGNYGFPGLADGTYVVKVNPTTLPAGFVGTGEGQPGTPCASLPGGVCDHSITASVSGGAVNNTVDFGYKANTSVYTVSGRVFNDNGSGGNAGNGIWNSGEPGLTGTQVCLFQGATQLACTTVDPTTGDFSFPGVANGSYTVRVTGSSVPPGYLQTGQGVSPGAACSGGSCTGSLPVTVSGANPPGQYFGYELKPASIAGTVCLGNGDGICNASEGVLAGVTVTLRGPGPDGLIGTADDTFTSTTTNASGAYSFTNLLPGPYRVLQTNLPGLVSIADRDGGDPDNIAVTLSAGQNVTGRDFEDQASIGDYVWYDSNQNGIQDPAEKGIAGMTVKLLASDGVTVLQTTQTDGSGAYRFDGILAASYVVEFVPRAGLVATLHNAGTGPLADSFDSDADPTTRKAPVLITNGSDFTIDAGFYEPGVNPARIGDFVWYDADHDGIQDAGEPGLGGVTVKLFVDANGDGTPDTPGTPFATTLSDGTGFYEFAGLPAGKYVVQFGAPTGYTRSPQGQGGDPAKDSDANVSTGLTGSITLTAGQNLTSIDAGLFLTGSNPNDPGAAISDFVWYDTNGNGIQDAGEPGLPGVVVNLYDATGFTLIASTTTSPTGQYAFAGLAAGSYTVEFVRPNASYVFSPTGAGTAATDSDPSPYTGRVVVPVAANQIRTDIDAGLRVPGQNPISIGDYVWKDLNGDNTPQSGEGLANAQVVLYDSLGNELARLTTNASDANYTFTGVAAGGSYRVAVDTSTIAGLVQIADPDGTLDNRTDLINQAASTTAVDFGYLTPNPAIEIKKSANPAHTVDSQQIRNPGIATFYITVTNTGNLTLSQVMVSDAVASDCVKPIVGTGGSGVLAPGESYSYTCIKDTSLGSVGAPGSDFTNVAVATAQPVNGNNAPVGSPVTAQDSTFVDVISPAITITKTATNSPIEVGNDATFSITVTNTGDVALTNVEVTDPNALDCSRTGGNAIGTLAAAPGPGNSVTYTCTVTNVTVPFTNVATVTGKPPVGPDVTDTGSANVTVFTPGLSISKTPDNQQVRSGDTVSFTILVKNTGTATLTNVTVSDPNAPNCNRNFSSLAADEEQSYSCTLANVTASFTNTATVTGTPPSGPSLQAADVANVTVIHPALSIDKRTNDDLPANPTLRQGTLVSWIYYVTNTGDVALTHVTVSDSPAPTVGVNCPKTTLAVGEAMTCFGWGPAILGPYSNNATVTGTPPVGPDVSAQDQSSYVGINPAIIGNYVWLDENGDGIQDAGEPGIANLTVELRKASDNSLVATTTTDGNGGYLFYVNDAGTTPTSYKVVVTPTSGLNPTYDEDGIATPNVTLVTVTAGQVHLSADFGYNWVTPADSRNPTPATTGAIGDRVWNDIDGDGLQDAAEAGIAGVELTLTGAGADGIFGTADDPAPQTTTTDASGNYVFDGLPQGAYIVTVNPATLPAGVSWTQTGDPDGANAVKDHKTTVPVVLAPGDVFVNADFGYRPASGSSIGDTIYLDSDGDKSQDVFEPGIAGVTVALRNGSGSGQTIATTLTDVNGKYLFQGLPAGTYTVVVTDTNAVLSKLELSADPDSTPDAKTTLTVDGSSAYLDADFGYTPFGQHKNFDEDDGVIGDTIFLDRNNNGLYDPGEGLQGVVVNLYASNGTTLLASTITNANGTYNFGRLDIFSQYVVKVDTSTLPNGGSGLTNSIDPDGGNDSQSAVGPLTPTGFNLDQDFGYTAPTPNTIGGTLWNDLNANGVLDVTETGRLAAVTVELRQNGNLVATTTTDANGNYSFTGLPAGTYKVHVTDTGNELEGWWKSTGPNPGNDGNSQVDPYTVTVSGGATNTTGDFGFYNVGAALGNWVWNDANANGVQDFGEFGASNVLVKLIITYPNGAGSTAITSLSGANGGYSFGNLLLDEDYNGSGSNQPSYLITVQTPPPGYTSSPLNQASYKLDSNDPAGTTPLPLLKGQADTTVLPNPANEGDNASYDFGYFATGSVFGHVYVDTNGNGTQDPGEPNLGNVTITITDSTGIPKTVQTDANGNYTSPVVAGPVTVAVYTSDPRILGFSQTQGDNPTQIVVASGENKDAGIDGFAPPASQLGSVTGHVYIDTNGNGTQDPGEPNLANVDVIITDVFGGTHTVPTDADGNYLANGVPAGAGSVKVDTTDPQFPAGYLQTEGDNPTAITVVALQTTNAGNDGFKPPASAFGTVTGHLYIDTNGNGTQDAGEPNLANVDVTITDVNGGTQTVTSGANGDYTASVPAGSTTAKIDTSDPDFPAGYIQTQGTDPTTVTAVAGMDTSIGIDGFKPPAGGLGTVTGHLYIDSNGNGVQDPGEPNLANVEVIVTDRFGGLHSGSTDASGNYTVSGIPAGPASVKVSTSDPDFTAQFPNGFRQTEGTDPTAVTVVGGSSVSAGNDGFQPPVGSIGNRVWLDENGNGIQDAGEAGIPNLKVELLNSSNQVIATTTTGVDGGYLFTNVPAGASYQVKVTPSTGLQPTYDEDGTGTPNTSVVTSLVAGEEYLTADFGYNWVTPTDSTNPASTTTGAIGDRVWNDANGNGYQDPGEAGIAGVSVTIYYDPDLNGVYDTPYTLAKDANGVVIATGTTTTDAAGNYIFDDLPPGSYVVKVTPPSGYAQTGDPDGTLDHQTTDPVVLAPGDVYVNADFGYKPNQGSTIGDRIFIDANGNGVEDAGEPGIPGVTVSLVKDTNNDGVWDAGEPIIATSLTNASGVYLFPGLPAGAYIVVVTDVDHVLGELVQNADPDGGNDGRSAVTVDGSTNNLLQDFGYAPLGQLPGEGLIGDTLFLDRSGNNAYDPGEGLEGVTVNLYDSTNLLIGTTVTNENGQYFFGALNPSATYKVVVDTSTLPNGGTGLSNTVDPDGGSDSQSSVNLTVVNPVNLAQDFGYRVLTQPNTISGTIWIDKNADGRLNEAGRLSGITVELRDANGDVVGSTTTDANGDYSFPGLPDGTYKVYVTDTANRLDGWWKSTGPNPGSDGNSQVDPYTVTISGGVTNGTADFGFYDQGAALGNRVWTDLDGNGIQDSGEPGLAGVKVTLKVTYPSGAVTDLVVISDGSGGYRFGNLLLDESFLGGIGSNEPSFLIGAVTPSGYTNSPALQGTDVKLDSNVQSGGAAEVFKGQTDTALLANPDNEPLNASYDFGFKPPAATGTISGHLFIDSNNNGVQDPGEPNLANVDVKVTDGNGTQTVTTGPDGNYSATVVAGSVTAEVDNTDPDYPTGFLVSTTASGGTESQTVTVTAGQNTATEPVGYWPNGQAGTITGHVYMDTNANGSQQAGEPNLGGVKVEITDRFGGIHVVTTDANGNYSASGIPAGPASVKVLTTDPSFTSYFPSGFSQTEGSNPTPVTVLVAGTVSAGIDGFAPPANTLGTVTGHLYKDTNGNGQQDAGEPDLANVEVIVTDRFGGTHSGSTDANGNYSIPGVPAGQATRDVDTDDPDFQSQFPNGYTMTEGTDPKTVTVPPAGTVNSGNNGYAPPPEPPQLAIVKTSSSATPTLGSTFTYTLTIYRSGGPANNPVVTDYLPDGVRVTAILSSSGWTCTPSSPLPLQGGAGATLSCTKGQMLAAQETIVFAAIPTAVSGTYYNYATITGDGDTPPPSPNPNNCQGTAAQNCDNEPVTPKNARIELLKRVRLLPTDETGTADGLAQTGETLTYAFTLFNRGEVDLTPVTLTDPQLEAGSLVCNPTTSLGNAFALSGANNRLRPNESVVCTGKHVVTNDEVTAGVVDNTATVTGKAQDGTPAQSTANATWENEIPTGTAHGDLALTKTAVFTDGNGNGRWDAGETVNYGFIVRNTGNVVLSNVTVTDDPVLQIDCDGNPNNAVNPVIPSLAVGASVTCVGEVYTLQSSDVTAGRVLDTATATGKDPSNNTVSDTDTRVINNGEPAGLALEKSAILITDTAPSGLSVGDTLKYTLVATNTGGVTLTNVTVADSKLGAALNAQGACVPAQNSSLSPGQQMVCTANYVVQAGEANPVDNLANATGRPVNRLLPLDAAANHTVPYQPQLAEKLYSIGDRVWMDVNDNGTLDTAERGIDGVVVRLEMQVNGTWVQATNVDDSPIADQVTAAGGFYQFTNVPERAGTSYRVSVLPLNFQSTSTGTRPLYGAVSSSVDNKSAMVWPDGRDQGVGIAPTGTSGVSSRGFQLTDLPTGATGFQAVDFGFIMKTLTIPPDLVMEKTQSTASVQRGGSLTYKLAAYNNVGAGGLTRRPIISDALPAGMTVAAGWPSVQPTGWTCSVNGARTVITCTSTAALPSGGIPGGSQLGAAINVPVVVSASAATGTRTNTATITNLSGEPSYTNNQSSVTLTITP